MLFRPAGLLLIQPLNPHLLADQVEQYPGLQLVIPRAQRAQPGGPAHPVPVLAHPGGDHGMPILRGETAEPTHDLKAGRHPLDVPLPRAGQGLVEIVDVEQHPPLRRPEQPEVRQVRIPAQLDGDPRHRRPARSTAMIAAAPR
jgi:hypothetical protein